MAASGITESELLEELVAALRRPNAVEGLTTRELADRLGWSIMRARAALQSLAADGRLNVLQRPAVRIDGRPHTVPVYALAKKR